MVSSGLRTEGYVGQVGALIDPTRPAKLYRLIVSDEACRLSGASPPPGWGEVRSEFEDVLPDVASRPVRRSFLEPERQGEVGSFRGRGRRRVRGRCTSAPTNDDRCRRCCRHHEPWRPRRGSIVSPDEHI